MQAGEPACPGGSAIITRSVDSYLSQELVPRQQAGLLGIEFNRKSPGSEFSSYVPGRLNDLVLFRWVNDFIYGDEGVKAACGAINIVVLRVEI